MRRFVARISTTVIFLFASIAPAVAQQRALPVGPPPPPPQSDSSTSNIDFATQHQPPFSAVHDASTLPRPLVGKVVSFNGKTLVLDLVDGAVRTFFVSPSRRGAEQLLRQGQRLAVTVDTNGNATSFAPADQTATATVVSVTKAGAALKMQNGRTIKVSSSALASLHAPVTPGMRVIFTTHDGGYTSSLTADGSR